MIRALTPVQERGAELRANPKRVLEVLDAGAERARGIARGTLEEAQAAMGLTRRSLSV